MIKLTSDKSISFKDGYFTIHKTIPVDKADGTIGERVEKKYYASQGILMNSICGNGSFMQSVADAAEKAIVEAGIATARASRLAKEKIEVTQ